MLLFVWEVGRNVRGEGVVGVEELDVVDCWVDEFEEYVGFVEWGGCG